MRISPAVALPDGRVLRGRFDRLTLAFHWLSALLVLFLLASGWARSWLDMRDSQLLLFHRSAGALVWGLTLLRFVWRQSLAIFPPFPLKLWRIARWAAQASEYGLYVLLFAQPATGLAHSLLDGRPFALFDVTVPALMTRNVGLSEAFHALHTCGAVAMAALAGMHAAAALFHHHVLRDDVLELMAPVLRRRSDPPDLRDRVWRAGSRDG